MDIDQNDAMQLWASLGADGKAPTDLTNSSRVLASYTAGIDPWIARLAELYLRRLCRNGAHFKLVLAHYGGGKTHFLQSLGVRGLEEGFGVSYVACNEGLTLTDPLAVYREVVKHLKLPGLDEPGLQTFLNAVVDSKTAEIEKRDVPDVEMAFGRWLRTVRHGAYPSNAFGRVMAAAIETVWKGLDSATGDAAFRWLQGDIGTLSRDENAALRLPRVTRTEQASFGRELMFSLVKFAPEAGVHGLVLLVDEVETLFNARGGKALFQLLAAMRVFLDNPSGVPGGVPLFGLFSAVPDIVDECNRKYGALAQRIAVHGASFDDGNDLAFQVPLDRVESQEQLLKEIGRKLLEVGRMAHQWSLDQGVQLKNAENLARVAAKRDFEVSARRMYVKTWVGLLENQVSGEERVFSDDELGELYQGSFESLRDKEREEYEP